MRLAKPLYRGTNTMLSSGVTLNKSYIDGIRRSGYSGAYIDDDLSRDIEVMDVISEELRMETMKGIGKIITTAQKGRRNTRPPDISAQVERIVRELSGNRDVMVNMLDLSSFDDYTYSHSLNVAVLSIILGIAMNFPVGDLVALGSGALLHDIGKVFINKAIIQKRGPLTPEEFEQVKTHSRAGYDYIMAEYRLPARNCRPILEHHERYDGSGYPSKKHGTQISLYGRITAVADVYDALTSERPYRKALPPNEGVEYIMASAGTLFDPEAVSAFTRRIAPYPVGTSVALSNGWTGLVIRNYASYCLRPKVRIYQQDGIAVKPFEISLKDDFHYLNVTIIGIS
jgi:HD-GYP domain-containing protein (c-di-GMP phosphodiesterase class II)